MYISSLGGGVLDYRALMKWVPINHPDLLAQAKPHHPRLAQAASLTSELKLGSKDHGLRQLGSKEIERVQTCSNQATFMSH